MAAPGIYLAFSIVYFGLSVALHPSSTVIGSGIDPGLSVWAFAWWPHAIAHGLNPFYSHVVWAPGGANLTWAGTVPAFAAIFSPLTVAAGPEVSFNVAAVLTPALNAWAGFLLCRYLTRRFWPSLAGGYLFGFSSYALGQQQGHFTLTGIFVMPLIALAVLRFLDERIGERRLVAYVALLIAFEVTTSTEIAFTMTLALAVSLVLGFLVAPGRRPRLVALAPRLIAAYGLAALVSSPFLYYALSGFQSGAINSVDNFPGDALNLVVPTGLVALSGHWANSIAVHFRGNTSEEDLYLGVPTLLIACWYLVRDRRAAAPRLLVSALALAVVASLGAGLYVKGHRVSPAPWAIVHHLPFFDNVISARMAVYSTLAASVIVALWGASAREPRLLRGALVTLAVLTQVPNFVQRTPWKIEPDVPAFFAAHGPYERCLSPHENVLVLPYFSLALLWQANDGFRYDLAAPYLMSQAPSRLRGNTAVADVTQGIVPPGGTAALLEVARVTGSTTIAVEPGQEPWERLVSRALRPVRVGGMLLYRMPGTRPIDPGCATG